MVDDIRVPLAASVRRAQQMAQMMALRDGFAAQAMAALLGAYEGTNSYSQEIPRFATLAYEAADAMLRQRGQAVAAKGQPS